MERINPVVKDKMAVSEFVFFETMGKVVSMAVAPDGAIASANPMYLAIIGILIIAKISRMTFVKNESTESSEL